MKKKEINESDRSLPLGGRIFPTKCIESNDICIRMRAQSIYPPCGYYKIAMPLGPPWNRLINDAGVSTNFETGRAIFHHNERSTRPSFANSPSIFLSKMHEIVGWKFKFDATILVCAFYPKGKKERSKKKEWFVLFKWMDSFEKV